MRKGKKKTKLRIKKKVGPLWQEDWWSSVEKEETGGIGIRKK